MHVGMRAQPQCEHGGQRTTGRSLFSPFTIVDCYVWWWQVLLFSGPFSWLILVLDPKLLGNIHFGGGGTWIYPELGSEVRFHCRLISHRYIDIYFWLKINTSFWLFGNRISWPLSMSEALFFFILAGSFYFGDALIMKNKRTWTLGNTPGCLPFLSCYVKREHQLEIFWVACDTHVKSCGHSFCSDSPWYATLEL